MKAQPSTPPCCAFLNQAWGAGEQGERGLDLEARLSFVLYWTGFLVSGNVAVLTAASELKSMGLSCHQ